MSSPGSGPQPETPASPGPQAPQDVRYDSFTVVHPIAQVITWLIVAGLFIGGMITVFVDENAPWWAAIFVILVSLFLFFGLKMLVGVSYSLRSSVMEIMAGYRRVKIPVGAVGYIGRARFPGRMAMRISRYNLVSASGEGVEIVTRDGKYVTARTKHADEVIQAFLDGGMHPDTLRIPFPREAVKYKHLDKIERAERA
ncbi:hypothetical protein [Nocardiopsis valliformis]|uniref:hypothetical protein n=1 Tax=Nocardiopsis valliformis TaxID=239974 RepID=UPI0003465763|nr:hypothetical protein [Nocardiopsis valliformis]